MLIYQYGGFHGGSTVKNLPANAGDVSSIPGQEDPLEKEMATHFSISAWEIPMTGVPGGLQAMGVSKESDTTQELNKTNLTSIVKILEISVGKSNK